MCWYVLQTFKNGCHPWPGNSAVGIYPEEIARHVLEDIVYKNGSLLFSIGKKLKTMEMSNIWGLVKTNSVSSREEYYIVIMTKNIFNNTVFLLTVKKLLNNIYIEALGFQQPMLSLHSHFHSSNTLGY